MESSSKWKYGAHVERRGIMATVSKWTPFDVALDLTATGSSVTRTSATQFTVKINASWETYYSGAKTNYGMTASSGGSSVTLNPFGTIASSGSDSFTGTYSISGNGAATKTITVTFRNFNTDNGKSATKTVSFSVSVPAWTSYSIKYNANGGSGAPGNQTKWKDQTLTLSSTKPTRTGYSFLGWSTSSSATSATYSAGGSYTANSAATLYAVWKANTYTVKYNANGGSGAPANQTKTYGKTLILSSTKPTRTNYIFKGWALSASATTAAYSAGGSYTTNTAVTLYAVWELAYIKPRIFNLDIVRSDSTGTADDEGVNALVTFDWECDKTVSSIAIKWKRSSDTAWTSVTVSASGTGGTVNHVIGSGELSTESSYDIHITVSDSGGSSYTTGTLTSMKFAIDCLVGGKGVAFGKTAELENTAEFEFDAKFNNNVFGNALGLAELPEIPANSDLNNYVTTGCYSIRTNTIAKTISNIPSESAGRLEVWSSTGAAIGDSGQCYLRQRFVPYSTSSAICERDVIRGTDNTWTYQTWYRTTLGSSLSRLLYHGQKLLWSGSDWMVDGTSISLSEKVSEQPNGIVLVFSKCDATTGTATNDNYNSFFVPKIFIGSYPGHGNAFTMMDTNFGCICHKYLYIADQIITGYKYNATTGTGSSGIKYVNNKYVLRYVYGV